MTGVRAAAMRRGWGGSPGFRWRGGEVSRLEGLSDAVFGFAITLLVVSLEVPHSFDQLLGTMRNFPAFGICFTLLLVIWHAHYVFFRRYGLSDGTTLFLNSALLFVVLFYVYPLKFVFTLMLQQILGTGSGEIPLTIRPDQGAGLLMTYAAGFMAVFGVFAFLYLHAWRRRRELELTAVERFDTVTSIQVHLIYVTVGFASFLIAAILGRRGVLPAGLVFFALGPALGFHGAARGRGRRSVQSRDSGAPVPEAPERPTSPGGGPAPGP